MVMFNYPITQLSGPKIPLGLIIPLIGGGAPADWTLYASANAKMLVGAGSAYSYGSSGGSTSVPLAGTAESAGAHNPSPTQVGNDSGSARYRDGGSAGDHTHTVSETATAQDVYRDYVLVKADRELDVFPANAGLLSVTQSLSGPLSDKNIHDTVDKFFRANSTDGVTGGSASSSEAYTSTSDGAHVHNASNTYKAGGGGPGASAGSHLHTGSLDATLNTKRMYASLWSHATRAVNVQKHMIAMIESATAPAGWKLMDGNNGTVDMRDFFIRIGNTSQHGSISGDNQCTYTTSDMSTPGSHSHLSGNTDFGPNVFVVHGSYSWSHTHVISIVKTVLPPYYALSFITPDW